jgi:Tfp pilus assembly protein PilW
MKKRKAITLIELLIYLAITTIVLVVVIDLVSRLAQNRAAAQGQTRVTQNARFLSDRLNLAINQASVISGNYPADSLTLTIDSSPVSFSLVDGQMFYQEGTETPVALTESQVVVSPINDTGNIFEKLSNGSVESLKIRFKITFKVNNFSRDFETAAVLEGK